MRSRRSILKSIAGLSSVGLLGGCATTVNIPDVVIAQSAKFIESTTQSERSYIYDILTSYIKTALEDFFEGDRDITVHIRDKPVYLPVTNRDKLLDRFASSVDENASISHLCLCSQTEEVKEPNGKALVDKDNDCSYTHNDTNYAVVTEADLLTELELDPDSIRSSLQAYPRMSVENHYARRTLMLAIHELGHNLCLTHKDGTAWLGSATPDKFNPTKNEDNLYISPMLGEYYFEKNSSVESIPELQTDGLTNIHYCMKFFDSGIPEV